MFFPKVSNIVWILLINFVIKSTGNGIQDSAVICGQGEDNDCGDTNRLEVSDEDEDGEDEDDMYWDALAELDRQLENATTLEDLIESGLLVANGSVVNSLGDLAAAEDEREFISTHSTFFQNAQCRPRKQVVKLNSNGVPIWPPCTTIERCTGCVRNKHQRCVPSSSEMVQKNAIKIDTSRTSVHLSFNQKVPMLVERHLRCKVECTLNAEICGPDKNFLRHRCSCKCKERKMCDPPKTWHKDSCSCKCPDVRECCEASQFLCPLYFDHSTCDCEPIVNRVSTNIDLANLTERIQEETQLNNLTIELEAHEIIGAIAQNRSSDTSESTAGTSPSTTTTTTTATTPTTSTTTTTTSTTTTTQRSRVRMGCDILTCPPNFTKRRNGNQCVCALSRRTFGRPRLRPGQRYSRPISRPVRKLSRRQFIKV